MSSLDGAVNVIFPEYIKYDFDIRNFKYADYVQFPKLVGGRKFVNSLKSKEGLLIPKDANYEIESVVSNYTR